MFLTTNFYVFEKESQLHQSTLNSVNFVVQLKNHAFENVANLMNYIHYHKIMRNVSQTVIHNYGIQQCIQMRMIRTVS